MYNKYHTRPAIQISIMLSELRKARKRLNCRPRISIQAIQNLRRNYEARNIYRLALQLGREDRTDVYFPFCDKLKSDLDRANGDVFVFMHHNIDLAAEKQHIISNADKIRRILTESGKCTKAFQGHYHPGIKNTYDGIEYVTFPALCENENAYFVLEL